MQESKIFHFPLGNRKQEFNAKEENLQESNKIKGLPKTESKAVSRSLFPSGKFIEDSDP